MMRRISRRHALELSGTYLFLGLTRGRMIGSAQAADDPAAALEIIAQLNQWRLEVSVPPLKPNTTLHDLALDQATYLSTLSELPNGNDLHIGRNGEGVRERALYPQFNWPPYGSTQQVAMSEVAAVGTVESAVTFWHGSELHRETITSPLVREIGVAAVTHIWGHIYIVVLGSRPDVLPALLDPRSSSVYLTQDAWLGNQSSLQVQLFDSSGRPLGGLAAWTPTMVLPANVLEKVYVLYTNGSHMSMAEVDLIGDQVILPGYIPAVESP
jgi:uncharacterized protein YkwD